MYTRMLARQSLKLEDLVLRENKVAILLASLCLNALMANAHVVVLPRETVAGATQNYTMRVPTEKAVATARIEAEFPSAIQVISVDEKTGWKIELKKDPSGKIIGATWSGSTIAPHDIAEFAFSARNPEQETELAWKIVQIYEDGTRSEWTGPRGSRTPASITVVKPR